MYNFMQCSRMLFGRKVRNCITFKNNQPGFTIYKRKYYHNAKIQLTGDSYEGAIGQNLKSLSAYVMAERQRITISDNQTFKQIQRFNITASSGGSNNDDFCIISMAISPDESKIALLLGKALIRDKFEITEVAVYKNSAPDG